MKPSEPSDNAPTLSTRLSTVLQTFVVISFLTSLSAVAQPGLNKGPGKPAWVDSPPPWAMNEDKSEDDEGDDDDESDADSDEDLDDNDVEDDASSDDVDEGEEADDEESDASKNRGRLQTRIEVLEARLFNFDADGDGFSPAQCDCDDTNPAVNPASEEVMDDSLDNDCDGIVDWDDGAEASVQQCTLEPEPCEDDPEVEGDECSSEESPI